VSTILLLLRFTSVDDVRHRTASGIRNAEMKWTNPERLDVYGVRLVGWPPSIPAQNPSSLKLSQNKELLECLQNGTMRFEKSIITSGSTDDVGPGVVSHSEEAEETDDFSWAYDADGGGPSVGFPCIMSACKLTLI
jgi:hypothetical protein